MEGGILIVDFGSQYTQLIARRIREFKVYSEIHPFNKINKTLLSKTKPAGIILSGGPNSVLDKNPPLIPKVLLNTSALSGVVLLVLATASMFSFILTFERIPHALARLIVSYADNWILFIILVHIVFIMLGMVMDALPAIIVLMPIFLPVAVSLGMEPIHLGILVAANVGIGMITPPVGICLFVACGISKTPIGSVVRPLLPFLIFLIFTLIIITMFPEITLFLPRLLGFI